MMAVEQYVRGTCTKCHAVVHIPVGDHTIPDLQDLLAVMQGFECPGQHVELGNALEQYDYV